MLLKHYSFGCQILTRESPLHSLFTLPFPDAREPVFLISITHIDKLTQTQLE